MIAMTMMRMIKLRMIIMVMSVNRVVVGEHFDRRVRIHAYVISKSYVRYLLVLHLTHAIRQTAHEISARARVHIQMQMCIRMCRYPCRASALHIIAYVIDSSNTRARTRVQTVFFYLSSSNHAYVCVRATIFNIFIYLSGYVTLGPGIAFVTYLCTYVRKCVYARMRLPYSRGRSSLPGRTSAYAPHQSLAFATIITWQWR